MRKKPGGFTLIEVLVSIGIMSILGLCLTVILRSGIRAWREGEVRTDTNATAQTALDYICRDFAAIFTKSIQPPGAVTIEIPTVWELGEREPDQTQNRIFKYFSNEWCTILTEQPIITANRTYVKAAESGAPYVFHFNMRFRTKKARLWIATYGDVKLEAKVFTPDNEDDESAWETMAEWPSGEGLGDLSDLIQAHASENGTDHIAIRATLGKDAQLMPGTDGPVLRFTAEPDRAETGNVRFLLHQAPGQPQKVVFVRNFTRARDPLTQSDSSQSGSLGEVCYLTTFSEVRPGEASPVGTLWRAARQPAGDWPVPEGTENPEQYLSLFDRIFITDVSFLATESSSGGEGTETVSVYTRANMQNMENPADVHFSPIAENVLYFGVQAWDDNQNDHLDDSDWSPGWTDDWQPERGIPKKVRIVLVLQPQTSRRAIAELYEDIGTVRQTTEITLDSAQGFRSFTANSPLDRFVKIGGEWVYYDNLSENRKLIFDPNHANRFTREIGLRDGLNRGLRAGLGVDDSPPGHSAGTEVHQGDTYVRTIALPYPKQHQ